MPLKHFTETILVLVLGIVIAVVGVLAATLPPLPQGWAPWLILMAASLLYPLVLYPMFRANRADYPFRLLHFFPALILLAWLLLQLVAVGVPQMAVLLRVFTWGHAALAVSIGFILLVLFCLEVIRRRVPRVFALLVILGAFLVFAAVNETMLHWDKTLAATLWGGTWWRGTTAQNPLGFVQTTASGINLQPSTNLQEEEWRNKMRAVEQRSSSVSSVSSSRSSQRAIAMSVVIFGSVSSPSGASSSSSVAPPKPRPGHLPSAGPGTDFIVMTMLAGYFGVLHKRAKRRLA